MTMIEIPLKRRGIIYCSDCKHRYMEGVTTLYYWCRLHDRPVDETDYCSWAWAEKALQDRPHGEWLQMEIVDDDMECGVNDDATECSVCGYVFNSHYWAKTYFNFCPNCGAIMVKGGDDE